MVAVTNNAVAILGFHDGSAGQVETWFEQVTGYKIACFVHEADHLHEINVEEENKKRISQRMDYPTNNSFKGYPLIVSLNWWDELLKLGINKVLPLTGDNVIRYQQIKKCREVGLELVSAIHPSVLILPEARIEKGVWINAGSIIGYKAEVEAGVIINTGCIVEHHNVLKECCQLAPGVVTTGHVTFWECSQVFSRSVIINRKQIGKNAIVGAGSVVIHDIPENTTAVGVPARVIKHHCGVIE